MLEKNTVSIVCACMDRTAALQISYKSWVNMPQVDEIIIVDWSSADNIKNILSITKHTKIVRVEGEKYFSLPRAYNIGIKHAAGDLILKLDVDYVMNPYHDFFAFNILNESVFFTGSHLIGLQQDRHGFQRYLNGLLYIHKKNIDRVGGYNEELKGYGYDDDDLYKRLHQSGLTRSLIGVNPCCVFHLPHGDDVRTSRYHDSNAFITSRQNYYRSLSTNESRNVINQAVCINLHDQQHLFEPYKQLELQKHLNLRVDRFEAIDSRANKHVYMSHDIRLSPGSLSQQLYFSESPGAVGCFISHLKIWQQIVQDQMQVTLVIEDDAQVNQLTDMINHYHYYSDMKKYYQYDLIQLNTRTDKLNFPGDFNGTESYIVTLSGAKKLLENFHDRSGFNNSSYPIMTKKQQLWNIFINQPPVNWNRYPDCIVAAVDTFIGMCSRTNDVRKRLNILHDPHVSLRSKCSSVFDENSTCHGVEFWNVHDESQVKQLMESDNFKWWEKLDDKQ